MQMLSIRSRVRAKYALWLLLIALPVPHALAAAQGQPARPDSLFFASLSRERAAGIDKANGHADGAGKRHRNAPLGSRARLISSDGRVLVERNGPSVTFVWLAADSATSRDSTWFEVHVPAATDQPFVIKDWQGRCLGFAELDATQHVNFGACDRRPIFAYPGVTERGFWIVSTLGYVGPTKVSPMLVPRSAGDVWFTIELEKAARH